MTIERNRRADLTRRTIGFGGLSLAAMLGGCSFLGGQIQPDTQADAGAKMRAKRPYKPANPREFAAIINAYRAENGLKPWAVDDRLTAIATDYSRHLADAGQMTHELQPYGGLEKRMKTAGYAYLVAGENLGEGHTDDEDAFEGWRHSPPHDRGLRDEAATVFGIASAYNPNDHYQAYWCLIFAKPRPAHGEGPAAAGPFHWGAAL
jgi:uncharacterized protein YkwD